MKTKTLIGLIVLIVLGFGSFFFLKKSFSPITPQLKETPQKECQFEIKEVYFKEGDDPQSPIL
ncbi:MAG: hypothetical protein QXO40_04125, partial [Candidatus Aenigmatarchaeota archaeon]